MLELLQALFSERFDKSVPQGTALSSLCQFGKDRIPVGQLTIEKYYSTENMLPNKQGAITAAGLPTGAQVTACHAGNVLVSNIRPYFKKILYCTEECGCSPDVLCFVPMQEELSAFVFCTLYADRFFDYMAMGSKGTKMPRGDKQQIMAYPVVTPSQQELSEFNNIAVPMLEQVVSNRAESNRLATLRDTLLPKLMSGEIDVSTISI